MTTPNWKQTPTHLGGGWTALTVPNSFVALTPTVPGYLARLQLPMGGSKTLNITEYDDNEDARRQAWEWALRELSKCHA